jgi:hypothetical protein
MDLGQAGEVPGQVLEQRRVPASVVIFPGAV